MYVVSYFAVVPTDSVGSIFQNENKFIPTKQVSHTVPEYSSEQQERFLEFKSGSGSEFSVHFWRQYIGPHLI